MTSQSYSSSRATGSRSPASPARWLSRYRTGSSALSPAANSGQYRATGASGSSCPRSASRWAASATTPLVEDQTFTSVEALHGTVRPGSAYPPHRSTTTAPSSTTATRAPSSRPSAKCRANTSRTPENAASHVPSIGREDIGHHSPHQGGRPEKRPGRNVVDAIRYVNGDGVPGGSERQKPT